MGVITFGEHRWSSSDILQRVDRVAAGFQNLGVGEGDGVAICLRNDVVYYEASLAAGAIGAFPVQVNWHYTAADLRYIIEDSGARALVVHADLLRRLRDGIPDDVAVLSVPTPPEVRSAYAIPAADAVVEPGDLDWATWRDGFTDGPQAPSTFPSTVIYTSGTTGRPKGVTRAAFTSHQLDAMTSMFTQSYGFHLADDPTRISTAIVGPTYHSAPNAHATFSFRAGANVAIVPRFDPEGLLQLIERERITHLNLVPIMFSRLLKLPREVRDRYDLSSLRYAGHAAAPCPPDVKRAMIDWWGPVIGEYYGATEMGNVTLCTSQEWLDHPGTVGRVMHGAEVKVLDENGSELPAGQIGEIAGTFHGFGDFAYNNDPEKRASVDRDGLMAPGDIGYFDEDGFLYIRDRKIDMIISGGVNIYPAEIEAALHHMPEVADCAVFGIPDDDYGEAVHAVVQPRADAGDLTAEDISAFLRDRVAGYLVPRTVDFSTDLPREDSGKIFKRKLREPFWSAAGRTI
ncbi:acyl-CoA synthetase [Pseudonocardia spinosispora]|uniref:acyl-CoA synthetase n=1 Tax=Pseudonocardia spinosispora TaxID=103441 RepID=UPI0004243165|nr:acyl-CoA synthetase [Pseudonocardia spinosispora]